ncbi:hypothetical protein L6R52_13655 [Myxococcota bacterium]|nr:hypothetical protein [Myxococcota bacterium]
MSVRSAAPIAITWTAREPPLVATGVFARGRSASQLADRLLTRSDDALARLRGVAGPGVLVVLGDTDALPWADGVTYLGRDPGAPDLVLPTALAPSAPAPLFERALARELDAHGTIAVVPSSAGLVVVPIAAARTVSRAVLTAWRAGAP